MQPTNTFNAKHILILLTVSVLTAQGQTGDIDRGTFQQNTYINHSLGLGITLAPGIVQNKEAMAIPPTPQTMTLIQAWGEKRPVSQRPGIVLYVDRLSYYPEGRRTSAAYISRVTRSQVFNGYKVVHGKPYSRLGSYLLNRVDLKRDAIREAVLVTIRRGWALVFIFAGNDESEINQLIADTNLEFQEAEWPLKQ